MNRWVLLLSWLVVSAGSITGCRTPHAQTHAQTPAQTKRGETHPTVTPQAPAHAADPPPPLTPERCHEQAEAEGQADTCAHWVVRSYDYCGGVAPQPGTVTSTPTCTCDPCLEDAECTDQAGGSCRELMSPVCGDPPARVCVYPDEPCYDPAQCELQCLHHEGRAACMSHEPPPP